MEAMLSKQISSNEHTTSGGGLLQCRLLWVTADYYY